MSTPTSTAATDRTSPTAAPAVDPDDPREHIEVGVLLANGRLAGRRFGSRAEAEAWARPDEGDQVVEYNLVCECSV
ncbi:hypothetical protein [Cellulomonas cellasea]|uniref:Uncharacterized protein n=1 Tax=Cellulomonas cellasea TaxID=43670 RepID=A0A4Y3L0Q4_9CELL|nr:hypothetical protein [Cellulomonas cellasea]GEA90219.1 hypothetical protein CCE01nite_41680 [Cellulomonas cellasea]